MTRQLFIYWKLDPAALPAALVAVKQAQAALRASWPGLQAQVFERCDPATVATVMETYNAPGGIDAAGEARIAGALDVALARLAPGPRHVEAFRPA